MGEFVLSPAGNGTPRFSRERKLAASVSIAVHYNIPFAAIIQFRSPNTFNSWTSEFSRARQMQEEGMAKRKHLQNVAKDEGEKEFDESSSAESSSDNVQLLL